ncbi:MAG: diaminopimelate epimerase, partial [Candidatus Aenigmarchaeota archaeon]|nr:diaminopimelate epimerase [Candidatus Aenigmarchaeota archaeon]
FNPDGSEAEMCGNAIRCVAKYVRDRNMIETNEFEIETLAGIIKPKVISSGRVSMVQVDMGEPIFERGKIPMAGADGKVIEELLDAGGTEVKITCVSMGNPHCVIFVEDVDFPEFGHLGKIVENHDLFPNRTNVEFVNVLNEREVEMRVWERGVGESLACGTGACASAVACVLNKKTGRDLTVHLKGGDLKILWDEKTNHIYMTGPAEEVFEGVWKN